MISTDYLRETIAKAQSRPLFKDEVQWALARLDIIDAVTGLAFRQIEELKEQRDGFTSD